MAVEDINQNTWGASYCLATCVLAVARDFGHDTSMEKLIEDGAVRARDGWVNHTNGYFTMSTDKNISYKNIIAEIDAGRPVIIRGTNKWGAHYVVADGYSGTSINDIEVMDPWSGSHVALTDSMIDTVTKYRTCT